MLAREETYEEQAVAEANRRLELRRDGLRQKPTMPVSERMAEETTASWPTAGRFRFRRGSPGRLCLEDGGDAASEATTPFWAAVARNWRLARCRATS